jgi:hypothetical protein
MEKGEELEKNKMMSRLIWLLPEVMAWKGSHILYIQAGRHRQS